MALASHQRTIKPTQHKQKSTVDHFLNILEEKQPKPEKIIHKAKLRYVASQISI